MAMIICKIYRMVNTVTIASITPAKKVFRLTDQYKGEQDKKTKPLQRIGDLEVKRFFTLIIDLRVLPFFQGPHNWRPDDIAERNEQSQQAQQVAQHGAGAVISSGRRVIDSRIAHTRLSF